MASRKRNDGPGLAKAEAGLLADPNPFDGKPLKSADDIAVAAEERIAALPDEDKSKLAELGASLVKILAPAEGEDLLSIEREPVLPLLPSPPLRYRVWSLGSLQRNGVTYQPGQEVPVTPEEAAGIRCLELVTE